MWRFRQKKAPWVVAWWSYIKKWQRACEREKAMCFVITVVISWINEQKLAMCFDQVVVLSKLKDIINTQGGFTLLYVI